MAKKLAVLAGAADATGRLELVYRPRASGVIDLDQVTNEMSAGVGAACSLRHNGNLHSPLVPTGDAAAGPPTLTLDPGDEASVVWTGAPPGAIGTAVFYGGLR